MKKTTIILMLAFLIIACEHNTKKVDNSESSFSSDSSIVNVYYFHGSQRCKTCIAVGDIAKKTVETAFSNKEKVRFTEINTSEKANDHLTEKYEVSWNALIIAKGKDAVDITEEAFATANDNPEALANRIKEEVNNRL